MKVLLSALSLAALSVPAMLPAPTAPAQAAPVPASSPADQEAVTVSLSLGRKGLSVLDLLGTLHEVTGLPVLYSPVEVGDTRLFGEGDLVVPTADLPAVAAQLLASHDYLLFEEDGPTAALRVIRIGLGGSRRGREEVPQRIVALADLDGPLPHLGGVYNVVLPLEHIDARSAMASFQPWFDTSLSGIRNVEASNSLLLSSPSLETLRHVVALVRQADQPRQGESQSLVLRVMELEKSLAWLTREVETLQAAADGR